MVKVDSVSRRALKVARVLDQMAAEPGRYVIEVTVEAHRKAWTVEFQKLERVGRYWSELDEAYGRRPKEWNGKDET